MVKQLIILYLCIILLSMRSGFPQDSLKIQYAIVGMQFHEDRDILKIKVPPWLKTSDLMAQIRRAVWWPGNPPPKKKTYVYVFKETDQVGETSKTGAVYMPNQGFHWNLASWKPTQMPGGVPTQNDFALYYYLIDKIIQDGSNFGEQEIRSLVAKEYSLTVKELDSIYVFVKYWLAEEENKKKKQE
jgi:hypothetical protein